jgi:hypothetical protein
MDNEIDSSVARLGGACAVLLGLIGAASSLLYVVLPADLQAGVPAPRFLPSFARDSTLLLVVFWTQAALGVLGLAVVPAVSQVVRDVHAGWIRWMATLATVGFAATSIGYLLSIERLPRIAAAYVAGDGSTQAALAAVWKSSIDLFGLWGYGAVGAWVLVVSILAFRADRLTRGLNLVGLAVGLAYLLVPLGTILKIQPLLTVSAAIGVVAGLIWYVGVGLRLRRM